jgi:hypothetical protein
MYEKEVLRQQLLEDMDRLGVLILRYARGEESVKPVRDALQASVDVKMVILDCLH